MCLEAMIFEEKGENHCYASGVRSHVEPDSLTVV